MTQRGSVEAWVMVLREEDHNHHHNNNTNNNIWMPGPIFAGWLTDGLTEQVSGGKF